jgi:hypothetical protein
MQTNTTNTKVAQVQVGNNPIKTVYSDLDLQNRQFVWNYFADGSALCRELTRHSRHAGSVVETWSEKYEAGSELAVLVSLMPSK